MKSLPLWIGLVGFLVLMGGIGRMETDPNGLWPGSLIALSGYGIMVFSLWMGVYLKKREEIPKWEREIHKKKRKRLGLA